MRIGSPTIGLRGLAHRWQARCLSPSAGWPNPVVIKHESRRAPRKNRSGSELHPTVPVQVDADAFIHVGPSLLDQRPQNAADTISGPMGAPRLASECVSENEPEPGTAFRGRPALVRLVARSATGAQAASGFRPEGRYRGLPVLDHDRLVVGIRFFSRKARGSFHNTPELLETTASAIVILPGERTSGILNSSTRNSQCNDSL